MQFGGGWSSLKEIGDRAASDAERRATHVPEDASCLSELLIATRANGEPSTR